MYEQFIQATLRGIASGLQVSYHALANDLADVNFSSARTGTLEDREQWKSSQEWIIESLHWPIYLEWLRSALAARQIKVNGQPLNDSRFMKYADVQWRPRRWPTVDPLKDVKAAVMAVENNMRSVSDVITETGRDPDEVWNEIQREQERWKELKIQPTSASASAEDVGEAVDDAVNQ